MARFLWSVLEDASLKRFLLRVNLMLEILWVVVPSILAWLLLPIPKMVSMQTRMYCGMLNCRERLWNKVGKVFPNALVNSFHSVSVTDVNGQSAISQMHTGFGTMCLWNDVFTDFPTAIRCLRRWLGVSQLLRAGRKWLLSHPYHQRYDYSNVILVLLW